MATVGILNGHNVRWFLNGTAIAKATTCSISFSVETRESSHKDNTGSWAVNTASKKSFTGSCDALVAEGEQLETLWAALDAGTELTMEYSSGVVGDKFWNVTMIVTGLDENADNDEDVTYTATFTGTGQPVRDTVAI